MKQKVENENKWKYGFREKNKKGNMEYFLRRIPSVGVIKHIESPKYFSVIAVDYLFRNTVS